MSAAGGDRRPNILFVTIDQWRADSLSCAGHPCARTPNIDLLAARGVRFARHYAQAAPCGPSRASLLTGTYLHTHRSVGNGTPLPSHLTNLALELRAAGYDPTLFGYTDTTADPRTIDDPASPWLRTYEGVLPGFTVGTRLPEAAEEWVEWLRGHGYDFTDVWDAYRQRDDVDTTGRGASWAPTRYAAEHSEAAFLVERFGQWHASLDAGSPWCAHVTFLRPHPPYVAPAPYHDLIDPSSVPAPVRHATVEDEGAEHPMVAAAMFAEVVRPPSDPVDMAQLQATYWGNLAEVDAQFGRLLDLVDQAGQADETLVVLTSDHGEQLGDHWMLQKLGFFEASYHVPLLVAGPGVAVTAGGAAGAVVEEHFTEAVDVMPTILELCGLPVPSQCAGSSLRPFLEGTVPTRWREAAHWEWDFRDALAAAGVDVGIDLDQCVLAVRREKDRKYVHFAGLPPAFYDLAGDPDELHNLADDPSRQAEVLECAQRMLSWRLSSDDQTLANLTATPDGIVDLR